MKKILMIIASQDFRDEELLVPKSRFESQAHKVTVASSSLSPAKGMLGAVIKPDILLKDVRGEDYDVVVYVGGFGAKEYWDDPKAHEIAKKTAAADKILAAICIAPVTLANAGVLKGKNAAVWGSEVAQLKRKGALVGKMPVVQDGKIITANGPAAAEEFAQKILGSLV